MKRSRSKAILFEAYTSETRRMKCYKKNVYAKTNVNLKKMKYFG